MLRNIIIVFVLAMHSTTALAGQPETLPVWPHLDAVKNLPDEITTERGKDGNHDRSITNVTEPTITIYLPSASESASAAAIICPGGGYHGLAIDKEGHDVARWLNSIGVAGIVLRYRMPHPEISGSEKPWPVQDAERALRLVRSRAGEWKIDPKRVGIIGFSAGGHLASTAGTHFEPGQVDAPDRVERFSTRPDFMILAYPVITFRDPIGHRGSRTGLLGAQPDPKLIELYSNDEQVTAETPPTFLVHARDDGVKVENSLRFAAALEKAHVPHELAVFDKGGHGFGLGVKGGEVATWPERCAEWMKKMKLR
jgi:acetyl esterase/lipase